MSEKTNRDFLAVPAKETMTIACGAFSLPESALLGEQTSRQLRQQKAEQEEEARRAAAQNTGISPTSAAESASAPTAAVAQEAAREAFYRTPHYQRLRDRYPVDIRLESIAGVAVEVITPSVGVSSVNARRVLLNCHGGAFQQGSRTSSQVESIPVAALGGIQVMSVDYRMYPEHRFPAAVEDTLLVYRSLLERYVPADIGLFGTSSGAQLAAQLIYRLQKEGLPLPAAVAMIAEGAAELTGDSVSFMRPVFHAQTGGSIDDLLAMGYYENTAMDDPAVYPALADTCMANFPPALLAASTRDLCLSSVLVTHRKLLQQGVEAQLHVWEGLDHFFHFNFELPEAEELHHLMLEFFTKHFA